MASSVSMPSFLSTRPDARPLAWWTPAQLDAMAGVVAQGWSAWVRDWVRESVVPGASTVLAHEQPEHQKSAWVPLGVRGEAAAWFQVRTDPVADVFETLFAADPGPGATSDAEGIGQAVAARSWNALADVLCGALELDPGTGHTAPDGGLFKPWSGCVLLSLEGVGRRHRTLLVNAACARALLGPKGNGMPADSSRRKKPVPLVPLSQALSDRKLSLQVELSSCELDFGSLQSLCIGDIVPLPHSLDAPLMVSTAQGAQVCAGFLGRQAGFKAIELARETPVGRETSIDHHSQRKA